jgi:hypothetical protein
MDKRLAFFTGFGVGAGVMYMLDPDRGKRRRALVRDQVVHASNAGREALGKASRDLRNRAIGVVAETKALFSDEHVPDPVLVDRIRACLGRYPIHHRTIQLDAEGGIVTLSGETLAKEVDTLVDAVLCVRGVNEVVNNLTVHETAEGISSLQGEPIGAEGAPIH